MTPADEVAEALARFVTALQDPARPDRLAGLLTPDAVYVTQDGTSVSGAEAIAAAVARAVAPYPSLGISVEWTLVDRSRAACWCWVHLPDPEGTDLAYEFPVLALLDHGGGGRWSRVQTFLNPVEAGHAVTDWAEAGGGPAVAPEPAPVAAAAAHPTPPAPAPDAAILEAVGDALVTENWLDLIETAGADWHDHGGLGIHHWAAVRRVERWRAMQGSRAVIALEHLVPAVVIAHVNEAGRVTYLDHLYDPSRLTEPSAR